jgi:multidrug efflux system outer membrane protein
LAARTAQAWFLAKELRIQVQFAEETVSLFTRLAARVRKSFEVGAISRENLDLAEADLAAAENSLRQVLVTETQTKRALELLLGRYPAASLETSGQQLAVPPPTPVGMPSELLERRPDLVAAERRVAAAFHMEEQARLARMPSFTISGGLGAANTLSGGVGSVLAGIGMPVYAPALEAQVAIANADQKAALAAYGQAVLRATEEVETALFNERIFAEREQFLASQVASDERALAVHQKQFEVGKTSILPLLQVQARYIGSQVLLTRVRNERLSQRIDLHLALGCSF